MCGCKAGCWLLEMMVQGGVELPFMLSRNGSVDYGENCGECPSVSIFLSDVVLQYQAYSADFASLMAKVMREEA